MPTKARRICPRCRQAHTGTRCPTCTERANDARPNAWYQTPQWRAISRDFLRNNPTCILCGQPSRVADHHPTSRRELLRLRDPNPDAWGHLRPLCRTCDRRESARNHPSGWNTPKG